MKEYIVTGGVPYVYGPRIYIEDKPEHAAIIAVLTKECVWGGYDKEHVHPTTGVTWVGFEFPSNPQDEPERIQRAEVALVFDGFKKGDAASIGQLFEG